MGHSGFDHELTTYERPMWRVLAALGRAGYFVAPQDARDLIHDFYLEEWAGLVRRYDSERSQFTTYLSAAFYRFARRRILSLERWRRRTADLEQAAERVAGADSPEQLLETREQIVLMRAALERLPAPEREVLYDFLSSGESNERALAQRHGLTRYRLRETLANGVGRLLIGLSGDSAPATLDARIAKSLWVDRQAPRQVAAVHGVTTAAVHAARQRFGAGLLDALRKL